MKHKRKGFTLIEVALFLAVTGLLLAGVFGMTQNSITAQRFNDSVQSFAEFLRRVYSGVENPQGQGADIEGNFSGGRTEFALYGKLVTFGENTDLDGTSLYKSGKYVKQKFFVYDVIAKSSMSGTGSVISMLQNSTSEANVVMVVKNDAGDEEVKRVGMVESFEPTWNASIDKIGNSGNGKPFTGSLLVVRHPRSGTITTLVSSEIVQVNEAIYRYGPRSNEIKNLLLNHLGSFKTEAANYCVNQSGLYLKSDTRRNVRIVAGARNTSGVEVIEQDNADNLCK